MQMEVITTAITVTMVIPENKREREGKTNGVVIC